MHMWLAIDGKDLRKAFLATNGLGDIHRHMFNLLFHPSELYDTGYSPAYNVLQGSLHSLPNRKFKKYFVPWDIFWHILN